MKFEILHEIQGRMRIHSQQKRMTDLEADTLQYYLENCNNVLETKVYERTGDVVIRYCGERDEMIRILQKFSYDNVSVPDSALQLSGRKTNKIYQEKLVNRVILRMGSKLFLPYPVRYVVTLLKSVRYIWKGICSVASGKIEVAL